MENVTIIVQGLLEQECYDFYLKNYNKFKVIISTWSNTNIDFSNLPDNFSLILTSQPKKAGQQNINYQLVSTINALKYVDTKYVIKTRGDEYWSNFEYAISLLTQNDSKLYTSSIWFRHFLFMAYHISDHLICGTTDNLKKMFYECKKNWDNHIFEGYHPEVSLTKSYLNKIEPDRFNVVDGRILMNQYFSILDIRMMRDYKIKAKVFKKSWYNNFKPNENYSIASMDTIFNNTNFYDTNIT
jgi:hypothetical protein